MLGLAKQAKDLNLSFNFIIEDKIERTLYIKANGLLRPIEWNETSFEWFMEDLVFYMKERKYQQRWDVGKIQIKNCKSLEMNKKTFVKLQEFVKQVTQWQITLNF